MTASGEPLLDEQQAYYRARAPEYDDWWQRRGRYDHGEEHKRAWRDEIARVEQALARLGPLGDTLELAAGTGWWTERLARAASSLTCVDGSAETLAINRGRLSDAGLPLPHYQIADLFAWEPAARFDTIFFSFWLSHVPEDRFNAFWQTVAKALRPSGRVFFLDSLAEPASGATNHAMPDADHIQERLLNDGRTFRIVKRFWQPGLLDRRLADLGWNSRTETSGRFFLYGCASLT